MGLWSYPHFITPAGPSHLFHFCPTLAWGLVVRHCTYLIDEAKNCLTARQV